MRDYVIKDVLEEIYSIDEKGQELDQKLDGVDEAYYQKLLENLKDLEKKYMKSARSQAKKKTKAILQETIQEEQAIMVSCYEDLDHLDEILENNLDELVAVVFKHIFY